jgi:hypothetical protein
MEDAVKEGAVKGLRLPAAPSKRPRRCNLCPSWIEPGSRFAGICVPCWRLLDTIAFKA